MPTHKKREHTHLISTRLHATGDLFGRKGSTLAIAQLGFIRRVEPGAALRTATWKTRRGARESGRHTLWGNNGPVDVQLFIGRELPRGGKRETLCV